MTPEQAERIAVMAAPILAGLLTPWVTFGSEVSVEKLAELRKHAIEQAQALWLDVLETRT